MEHLNRKMFTLGVVLIVDVSALILHASKSSDKAILGAHPQPYELTCTYKLQTDESLISLDLKRRKTGETDFIKIIGYPSPTLNKNASYLDFPDKVNFMNRTNPISPTEQSTMAKLQFSEVQCDDKAEYQWELTFYTTNVETASQTISITVQALNRFEETHSLSYTPNAQIAENTEVTFTCSGDVGNEPTGSLLWFYYLNNDTSSSFNVSGDAVTQQPAYNANTCSYTRQSTLRLTMEKAYNGIIVRCAVGQFTFTEHGDAHTQTTNIPVYFPIQSVTMTQPVSDAITIVEDTQTTFTCRADGLTTAAIKWYKVNGTPSTSNVGTLITNTGSTTIDTTSSTLDEGLIRRISTLTYRPTRSDNGMRIYCSASNGGLAHISTRQPLLNVLYEASVISFKVGQNSGSVTVTENTSPTLVCSVDSNPASNINILFKNQTLTENTNTLQLAHQLSNVSCSNIGVYKCTGGNYLNAQTPSTKYIELLVKCKPQAYGKTVATIYTPLHYPSTLRLHSLAYPTIKSFTWTKLGTPDEVLENSTKVSMNMSRVKVNGIYIDIFQLDLALNNVSRSDFGKYIVHARNDQGTIVRDFVLEPEDAPEAPTRLTHMEQFIKTTTAIIQWTPGYNGGTNQTFILSYKKLTEPEWKTISVKESGESIMNFTLTDLQSDTQYEVKIHAQNRVGNSSATGPIEIRTLAIDTENPINIAPIIGGVAGGATGLVIVIALVVVFLWCYDKKHTDTEVNRSAPPEANRTNEDGASNYYNIGSEGPSEVNNQATYYNEGVVSEYETLNQHTQDMTTYSPLQPSGRDQNKENKEYQNLQLRVN